MSRREPWEETPGESVEAHRAFLAYRDIEAGRTLEGARKALGKGAGYRRLCERWSSRWRWVDRARAWDDHLRRERDGVAAEREREWERRRLDAMESAWEDAQVLRDRARRMMEFPLVADRVEDTATGRVTVVEPARWTFDTLVRLVKVAAELEAAVLAEALPRGDDGFDPATATPDECRAFLVRYDGRKSGGAG